MIKIKLLNLSLLFLTAFSLLFLSPVSTAQGSNIRPADTVQPLATTDPIIITIANNNETIRGMVLKNENNQITVQTNDGIMDFNVSDDIRVTKNMLGTSLDNIQPNDSVVITRNDFGEVLSVEAVSGSLIANADSLIPILLLGVGLIILGLLLSRNKAKGQIKTKPSNLS